MKYLLDTNVLIAMFRNRALLESQGTKIDSFDLLIGSSAVNGGLTIVTHNKKHFARIPNLQIEDWEE